MSRFIVGNIRIDCSIDILRKVLIKTREEWKNRIQIDTGGNLSVATERGSFNCHILVKDGYASIGFQRLDNGQWKIYNSQMPGLENKIKEYIAIEKIQNDIQKRGGILVEQEQKKNQTRMVVYVPASSANKKFKLEA